MYYIFLVVGLILAYLLVVRMISSLFKGCIIVLGIGLLAIVGYIFITSGSRPVNILNRYVVEDFSIRKIE